MKDSIITMEEQYSMYFLAFENFHYPLDSYKKTLLVNIYACHIINHNVIFQYYPLLSMNILMIFAQLSFMIISILEKLWVIVEYFI